ncbi:MAG: monovalent cation/H+ antiporter subunit D [Burkholderiales bacterium]|nr:monovalent cation/H+ antiporter subunit D [Burkholderiales bacterium]
MIPPEHLVVVPVVLPLAAGAAMLMLDERRVGLKAGIALAAALALVAAAAALAVRVDADGTQVYRLGDWAAPFGIVLVADRLSALLVLLAAVLGLASLSFALARWHRAGPRFHALHQFLLMGVSGAFLTGDLFNLFVFFEVLLAASYALALHGSGVVRVMTSLHYIAVNVAASLVFLVGIALVYAVTGTLNIADVALRVPAVAAADRALLEAGAALLGVAFLVKAGLWPLCFWLPGTYAAASAPAAALFAVLTKVGVYAVLRVSQTAFGDGAGASAGFGAAWVAAGGLATLAFGTVGMLASQDLPRIVSYGLVASSGTLLAAVGLRDEALTGAALYYLVASTLAASAMFLIAELMERGRAPGAQILAVTAEWLGDAEDNEAPERDVGVSIPGTLAVLGLAFASAALVLAGLPPLAGFLGKFLLLDALLGRAAPDAASWTMLGLLLASGLAAIVAFGRTGIRRFWAAQDEGVPRVRVVEFVPVALLLLACAVLTFEAGGAMRYLQDAARTLHAPGGYVERVLEVP